MDNKVSNISHLLDAMTYVKPDWRTTGRYFTSEAIVQFIEDGGVLFAGQEYDIAYRYDDNQPYLEIPEFLNLGQHSEYSTKYQEFRFSLKDATLSISGTSEKKKKYKIILRLPKGQHPDPYQLPQYLTT